MQGLLADVRNYLKGDEDYKYANILPLARSPEGALQFAMPGAVRQGLLEVVDSVTLPGDVYAGRRSATPEDAANFGLSLLGGSSVVPKPDNALSMFGGPRARTFNPKDLEKAQHLDRLRSFPQSPREIYDQTGLTKGVDGMFRFEIDDSQATLASRFPEDRIKNLNDALARANEGPSLGDILRHPLLYENYPALSKIGFKIAPEGSDYAGVALQGTRKTRPVVVAEDPRIRGRDETMRTILHEGQHLIQDIEGFETGANTSLFTKYRPEIIRNVDFINQMIKQHMDDFQSGMISREQFDSTYEKLLNERDKFARFYDPQQSYKNVGGEVESRNVENRMNFTPNQRAYTLPVKTEDVPRRDQILKKDFYGLLGIEDPFRRTR